MARMTNSILALSVNLSRDRQRRRQSRLIMQRSRWRGRDLRSRQLDKALLISVVLASTYKYWAATGKRGQQYLFRQSQTTQDLTEYVNDFECIMSILLRYAHLSPRATCHVPLKKRADSNPTPCFADERPN